MILPVSVRRRVSAALTLLAQSTSMLGAWAVPKTPAPEGEVTRSLPPPRPAKRAPAKAAAAVASDEGAGSSPALDGRVDMSELYTFDDMTSRHISYSELRGLLDATTDTGPFDGSVHVDARLRHAWNDQSVRDDNVSRLYLQLGDEESAWSVIGGRHYVNAITATAVDGVSVSRRIAAGWHALVFGGLRPHPLSTAVDPRFTTAGVAYERRDKDVTHAGGLAVQGFSGQLDRAYLSERAYVKFGPAWLGYAQGVVDFLAPAGVIDDLHLRQRSRNDAVHGLDLTQAQAQLRYRQIELVDLSLVVSHAHTIVPNRWWQDWLRHEREIRGFAVDSNDAVGTRRSTATLTTNLHASRALTPYVVLRYDVRHSDRQQGYEARPGLKWAFGAAGYLDVSVSQRQYFGVTHQQGAATLGLDLSRQVSFELGGSVMRQERPAAPAAPAALWLYDAGAMVRFGLGAVASELEDLELLAQYQGFLDDQMLFHLMMVRLGYRVHVL